MNSLRVYVSIAVLGVALFFPFLGASHLFDWDEINFAEASREMIETGNYTQTQVDFRQFWEKPPLFFWLQAAGMHMFGVNAFGARFPNAVCGILTLIVLYAIGRRLKDEAFAGFWVLCYAASILPQFYFKSGIIDPWFNLFIFLSVYGFIRYLQQQRALLWLCVSGVAAGLSALTKGPVGIGLIGLTIGAYFVLHRFRQFPSIPQLLVLVLCVLLPIAPWVLIEISHNGTWFIKEFFTYQLRLATTEDASHGGFPGYHFVVILFFCFPASTFAISNMLKSQPETETVAQFRKWMLILFWVVLIVFSIVQTKIAHYSSMAYFPLTFLAALRLSQIDRMSTLEKILLAVTGYVFALLLIAVPYVLQHPELIEPMIKDKFTLETLGADGGWSGAESLIGVLMAAGLTISLVLAVRQRTRIAITVLMFSAMLSINFAINFITPRIERYSQGAMVDFFIEKSQEDCYTDIAGFKSYAHLFYGRRSQEDVNNPIFLQWARSRGMATTAATAMEYRNAYSMWLLEGNIDKPVYFVSNTRKAPQFDARPQLQRIGSRNGYYFYKREPEHLP